ncbi:MAG: PepSY domain-containing protein [Methylococcales bacterium]
MHIGIKRLFLRTAWLKIHLYLALSVGFLFALMGLTGSFCVYRDAVDTFLNPELVVAKTDGKVQSLDRIIAAVKAANPNRHGSWTLEMPSSADGVITAWYDKPQETFFDFHAPLMVSIDPYTAEVVASRFWGKTLMTWLLDLHTQLRLDGFGWNSVGVLGLLLLVSLSSGLYLWWPGGGGILSTFNMRVNAGQRMLVFDMHRLLGLLSAPVLLLLAFTGFHLSYPQVLEVLTGSSGMAHGETGRVIISTADPTNHPTTLAGALFVARSAFPKAELRRISTPVGDTGVYRINFRQGSEINRRHPFSTVWVDHWSGQIKEIRNPEGFSTGETLVAWVWPLHTGEAFGAKGRFVWFLAGLGLFVLYVTGLLLWLFRTGRVQDKAVNIEALRAYGERVTKNTLRMGLVLLNKSHRQLQGIIETLPQYKIMLLKLWRRAYEAVINK